MPLLVASQRSEAWYAARKGVITASVASGCLGLCPYMSRQEAWRKIMGTSKQRVNRFMEWGTEQEPTARAQYEVVTGNLVTETGFWTHSEYSWLGASPDGLVGSDGLLEGKCPQKLPLSVPIFYRVQIIIQLAVTGRKWCDFFSWTPEGHFIQRVYPSGAAGLIRGLKAFYEAYVKTGVEPPRKRRKKK